MFFLLSYLFFEKKAEYTRTYILNEWINRRKTWSRRSRVYPLARTQVIISITSFIDIVEYDGVEFGKITFRKMLFHVNCKNPKYKKERKENKFEHKCFISCPALPISNSTHTLS